MMAKRFYCAKCDKDFQVVVSKVEVTAEARTFILNDRVHTDIDEDWESPGRFLGKELACPKCGSPVELVERIGAEIW